MLSGPNNYERCENLQTRVVVRLGTNCRAQSNVIATSALRTSGLGSPEDLAEALTSDSGMIALTQKILFAASVTGNDRKLRAFGNLLGGAVVRHARRLDETNLLVDALADLEDQHVVITDVISAPPPIGDRDGLQPKSRQKSRSKQTWYSPA